MEADDGNALALPALIMRIRERPETRMKAHIVSLKKQYVIIAYLPFCAFLSFMLCT